MILIYILVGDRGSGVLYTILYDGGGGQGVDYLLRAL